MERQEAIRLIVLAAAEGKHEAAAVVLGETFGQPETYAKEFIEKLLKIVTLSVHCNLERASLHLRSAAGEVVDYAPTRELGAKALEANDGYFNHAQNIVNPYSDDPEYIAEKFWQLMWELLYNENFYARATKH